ALTSPAPTATPSAFVSSGAALALEAARHGLPISKLALFEAPFITDDSREPVPLGFREVLIEKIANGQRGKAVKLFMKAVGVPGFVIALMPLMPAWSKLKRSAHTLPNDFAILDGFQAGAPLPAGRWSNIDIPILVLDGGKSPRWMRNAMKELAESIPAAKLQTLPGQTHMVKPKVLGAALAEFFK
ncbi:MAG: alpha/beta hydrolase, partial [Acidobacteriota bacterium]